jgi:hypothetical protein
MAFQFDVFLLIFFLILSLAWFWRHGWLPLQPSYFKTGAVRTTVHRLLKPRTPDDCPLCHLASTPSLGAGPVPGPIRPWREVKSRRGARHPHRHSRVRLSMPAVLVLWDHRCAHPRGFSAMASMVRPSVSRPFEALPAAARLLHDGTRPCTV